MKDESASIMWPANLCSSLCRTLAMSVSLPRILPARCYRWNAVTLEAPCSRGLEEFPRGDHICEKIEDIMQRVIGLSFQVPPRTCWFFFNEVLLPGAHAPNHSAIDCNAFFIEKKLSLKEGTQHICVKEEEWKVIFQDVTDGKESGDHFTRTSLGARSVGMDSDCIHASLNQRHQL